MIDRCDILLVNTNRMTPPIAPIGLDYLAAALRKAGLGVRLLDLAFERKPHQALRRTIKQIDPDVIGLSFRNTDDCYFSSQATFVPELVKLVRTIRRTAPDTETVLGGSGYAIFPEALLEATGAEWGIVGDAEGVLPALLSCGWSGRPVSSIRGLVAHEPDGIVRRRPRFGSALSLGTDRSFVDNERYFREGGQIGIETKRGCPNACVYCADPVAKGHRVRVRSPQEVADEVAGLLDRGIDVLHTCDAEFNIPADHAAAVCERLIARRLGQRVRWYAYCVPRPFDSRLAELMARAGCVGVNVGADSGCAEQLRRLGRNYGPNDLAAAVKHTKAAGMAVMVDLLLGGPGETPATVAETIALLQSLPVDCVGAPVGVRLYPDTPLAKAVLAAGPMADNPHLHGATKDNASLLKPVFYVDRALGDRPAELIVDLIAGDQRFFPPQASRDERDYNYNDNTVLAKAIAAGARGAYWHILHRLRTGDRDW